MHQPVHILIGPTSSGKTSLALELCHKFGGEIISADSRQLYKYMDIGTGKVPLDSDHAVYKGNNVWEIDGVKIWGYDLVKPDQYFSSFDFVNFALDRIKKIEKRVFIVGGTGFYIDMLLGNVTPANIPPDFELREYLDKLSLPELQARYKKQSSKSIDLNNPARLKRAIEKLENTGELGAAPENNSKIGHDFVYKIHGLTAPRNYLYGKVDLWVEAIWDKGLLEETKWLINAGYAQSPKMNAIIYKQVVSYLSNEKSRIDAVAETKFALHAYIRRQQTYFKKMKNVFWQDILQDNYKQNIYNILSG